MIKTEPTYTQVEQAILKALVACYKAPKGGAPTALTYEQTVPIGWDVGLYTPQGWRDRGERADANEIAHLSFDGETCSRLYYGSDNGKLLDAMRRELAKIGCYFGFDEHWHGPIYPSEPRQRKNVFTPVPPETMRNGRKVYHDDELSAIQPELLRAQELWAARAKAYLAEHGDRGTCVLGAGIALLYQAEDENVVDRIVIKAPGGQGSLTWESSVEEIVAMLKTAGVDVFYAPGRMD